MLQRLLILCLSCLMPAGCDESPSGQTVSETDGPVPALAKAANDARKTLPVLRIGMPGKDIKIACILLAHQLGFYAGEGLDVRFETISNLSEGLTAVTMNKLDVLPFGVIPAATFVAHGSDVVVFGGTISEGSELVVRPENRGAFRKPRDFMGKKIGCYRMETGHMVMKGWLRENGLVIGRDVTFVLLDSQPTIIEAVRKGVVDVGFLNSGQGYVAIRAGLVVDGHVGDFVPDFPCCRQTASRAFLTERRADLVRFQVANLRAYDVFLNDRETALDALTRHSGQPRDFVEAIMYGLGDYQPAMIVSLDPNKIRVGAFYEVMRANGDIPADTEHDMARHIDVDIYREALGILRQRHPDNPLYRRLEHEFESNNVEIGS